MHPPTRLCVITLLMAFAVVPARAQHRPPDAAQCRQMVEAMVQTMKSTPVERAQDQARHRALLDQVDRLIRDHRARGVGDCETWAAIGKMITRQ